MLDAYTPREHARALDAIASNMLRECDRVPLDLTEAADLARLTPAEVSARVDRQRRELAPYGLCPECGEPLRMEPDSLEPWHHFGARGAHVVKGGTYCPECCVAVERGAA